MIYKYFYQTPKEFSDILITGTSNYLTGLCFENSGKNNFEANFEMNKSPVIEETIKWLNIYFSGKSPDFIPKYKITGLTPFREEVINAVNSIPFGKTVTYGEISKIIAEKRGIKRMSAQAVGGAVGWNPICIIIPCHRVMGANGKLTGYGGGINNKAALLKLENILF